MTRTTRDNLVSGGVALGSGFVLAWVIPNYTPPYPGYGVSSALLPNVAFGIILGLSLLLLGHNLLLYLRGKSTGTLADQKEKVPPEEKVHLGYLAFFLIPCFLLMPAMKWIGFIPGGLLFMLVIQILCGQRKPVTLVIVAVCTVGAMYAAMRYGLGVPMP